MNKKFISLIMAALLAVSAAAVSASAVETDEKTAGAEVSAETAADEDKKTFFFDSGNWNSQSINFYIWDTTKGDYATGNNGWVSDNTWGSKKKLGGTAVEGKPGVFESYEVDFSGRENDAIYVIFHDPDSNAQTFDALINTSVYGHTASRNGVTYENPEDSKKTAEGVNFDGGDGLGIAKVITSTGKIQGDIIHPSLDPAQIVADYVFKYQDNSEANVSKESVQNAIAEFGTTADAVWEKYQTKSGEADYADKEAKGKEFIAPTSGSSNDTSSTSSDNSSSTTSSTSSSGSSTSTTKTSTTGTTTTGTSGTSTATTGGSTTGSADTASTGDTRGVVAFAGVLVAAAGTIVATRKKIED